MHYNPLGDPHNIYHDKLVTQTELHDLIKLNFAIHRT